MRYALIHGFAGGAHVWDDVIASWRGAPPPIAITLPGHGAGPVLPTWEANLDAIAAQVADADVVVGYSLGARIALGLVESGRSPRAILIGVNPGIAQEARAERRASDAAWAQLLRARGVEIFVDAWQAQAMFDSQARFTARRAERRKRRLALDREQLARSLEVMGLAEMPDHRADVARCADRLVAIVGADDAKYVAIARELPIPLLTIPSCGHDPTLEQPAALAVAITELTTT
ncbi:MAG: alpha/beta fold hydrolase [Deltaproteobacteria bacterium]|nr:alpha/beta fold hydrolase [Deltaproteobacteria bacterium]